MTSSYVKTTVNQFLYFHSVIYVFLLHDDVIKWKRFCVTGPLCGEPLVIGGLLSLWRHRNVMATISASFSYSGGFIAHRSRNTELWHWKTKQYRELSWTNYVVSGDTRGCNTDTLWCRQWRQSYCHGWFLCYGRKPKLHNQWPVTTVVMQHISLRWTCCHFGEIVVFVCKGSCHFDNFQCNQLQQFR